MCRLKTAIRFKLFIFLILLVTVQSLYAQRPNILRGMGNGGGFPRGGGGGGNDSLKHRTGKEDSVTINFRFLDSTRNYSFDSSVSDYARRFPVPPTHVYLGNVGTAAHSLLFTPGGTNGWDPGFHAFDVYKWRLDKVRFFNTTRPYTELGFILGSQSQQNIELLHTQNIRPYWNFSLGYRLINAPGFFKNQKTNHNNYLVSSWYESPKKRYNNYFVILGNSMQSGENGGMVNPTFLDSLQFTQRFSIPTRLGGNTSFGRDIFNTTLSTGNRHTEVNFIMRQQYDFGRKDSLVTDSTVIPLFYPRLRMEHTLNIGNYNYLFQDLPNPSLSPSYFVDSAYYKSNYDLSPREDTGLFIRDRWREITNSFSIYQFPDAKNLQQFIKAGISYQLLRATTLKGTPTLYNIMLNGEYRNRTRNKKWDAIASGNLYVNGYNAGDYHAYVSLQRFLSKRWGSLLVGFQNTNRSPSFQFDERSSFYFDASRNFSKENTVHFFGTVNNPALNIQLGADYYLVTNYLYVTAFSKLQQENAPFNVLRINALKTFKLSRYWRVYSEVYLQQKTGNADVNFPLLFTRNRIAFEGNFFRNLFLSTGLEVRYHSPYQADEYSPLLSRFFYQDSAQVNNRPDVAAYLNFRIRSFKAYVRAENLNAASFDNNGFGFRNNNLATPTYAYPGMVLRFGFYWSFVN